MRISFDSSTEDLLLSMLPPAICCASVMANMVNKKYEFKQLFKTVTLLSACLLTIIGLPVVICILQDGTTAGVSPVTIKAAEIADITLTMSILCDSI